MFETDPHNRRHAHWTLISAALFILGLAILVPSGLCTASMGYFALLDASEGRDLLSGLSFVLIFGGVPMAVGAVLVYAGLKTRRRE
jgi:hypothetical protein